MILIKDIVKKKREGLGNEERRKILKRIDAIGNFLKYSYKAHLRYNCDDDRRHDMTHVLLLVVDMPITKTLECKL